MLRNYTLSDSAESENRKRGLKAAKFRQGGKEQWDEGMLNIRIANNRPSESYNQIPQFLHQVTNDMRMNMPQTKLVPGNDGTEEVAEAIEDLCRNIQASSEAEVAYDNAVDSQVTIGWGYFRYITEYENDKNFDQIIKIKWVPNPFMVYDDPTCTEQDFSDRKFLIQCFDIPKDEFNEDRTEADKYDSQTLQSIGNSQPSWATDELVRVAEYWEVKNEFKKMYRAVLKDGYGEPTFEKPKGKYEERDVSVPKVMWYKCTALEVLEEKEWPGIYIPYVRISGEMQIVDGKTYYSGLVEGMITAQKQYNYWSNTATEIMGMVPLSPWIAAVGQIEGLEAIWDVANVKRLPYLPYSPVDVNGTTLPPPQRSNASTDISGALALVQQAQQNFYTTTGIYPASLGQASNEKSGKAILARQREGDTSTYHFMDNLARGLRFGGRIMIDLIPKIYDGSRVIQGMKEDKSTVKYRINQEYRDEQGNVKNYDLTTGTYGVMVTTGPSYTTKRIESQETLTQMAQAFPALLEVAGSDIMRNMDFPGAENVAEKLQIVENTKFPQFSELDKESVVPPQVQAQMAQMQQIIQELGTQLQASEQQLNDKQADTALKVQQMQINETDSQRQAALDMDNNKLQREKMAYELIKAQMTNAQNSIDKGQPINADMTQFLQTFTSDENVLGAMMTSLAQKQQNDVLNKQAMEEMAIQEQVSKTNKEILAEQTEANRSAIAQENLKSLAEIKAGILMLTQAIAAPKIVQRDPKTGLATGVVTVDTIGSA